MLDQSNLKTVRTIEDTLSHRTLPLLFVMSLLRFLSIILTISPATQLIQQKIPQRPLWDQEIPQQRIDEKLSFVQRNPAVFAEPERTKACGPCDEVEEESRREAAFAMLGTLWAVSALPTSLVFPLSAEAVYGPDANVQLPNPIDAMNDRATKQCLMESLGNRECLVYAEDADKFLYKGTDSQVLLSRVQTAAISLTKIPALTEEKKWSQVSGFLTGPLGELVRTLGQLAAEDAASQQRVKQIKTRLYAMSAAVDRKDGKSILENHNAVTQDLVDFVKALS